MYTGYDARGAAFAAAVRALKPGDGDGDRDRDRDRDAERGREPGRAG
jgi:hypothetical protein